MPSYRTERTKKSGFLLPLAACIVSMAIAVPPDPFLPNIPGHEWKKVGYLNMSDPAQQCPSFWKEVEPMHIMLRSCGKKTNTSCDSLPINISASFQHVCGRFRGYQVGTPDAFYRINKTSPVTIDTYYVDGISITYGLPGSRHHVYTYAVGNTEFNGIVSCPCAGGKPPPLFVNECDYYCESGSKKKNYSRYQQLFDSDVLWDGQQCDGSEITCCRRPDLPWFCKSFLNPISENLEVRICTDEPVSNENIALDFFELYVSVLNPSKALPNASVSTIFYGTSSVILAAVIPTIILCVVIAIFVGVLAYLYLKLRVAARVEPPVSSGFEHYYSNIQGTATSGIRTSTHKGRDVVISALGSRDDPIKLKDCEAYAKQQAPPIPENDDYI